MSYALGSSFEATYGDKALCSSVLIQIDFKLAGGRKKVPFAVFLGHELAHDNGWMEGLQAESDGALAQRRRGPCFERGFFAQLRASWKNQRSPKIELRLGPSLAGA